MGPLAGRISKHLSGIRLNPKFRENIRRWIVSSGVPITLLGFAAYLDPQLPRVLIGAIAIVAATCLFFYECRPAKDDTVSIDSVYIPDDQAAAPVFEITIPPTPAQLRRAVDFAKQRYSAEAFSVEEMMGWIASNPLIVGVMTTQNGEFAGAFNLLPLSEAGVRRLLKPDSNDRTILPEHILSIDRRSEFAALYVGDFEVANPKTDAGKVQTAALLRGVAAYIERYYSLDGGIRVLAIAATPAGRAFSLRLRGKLVDFAENRKDHHDLFEFSIDAESLAVMRKGAELHASSDPVIHDVVQKRAS
jgi:hypothetical protein